jgi:hypothetical protein
MTLLEEVERILNLVHQKQLRILPVYIPSAENIQTDAALRFQSILDWHLSPEVFAMIEARWGLLAINLFASHASAQTRRFFSWSTTDNPEAVNALCQKLVFDLAFLFPPIPLLKRVMKKLETSRGTFLLITPFWEAQTWFASLLTLKVEDVRRLPFNANLLVDFTTGAPPTMLETLHLVVRRIIGGVGASHSSLTELSVSSRQGGYPPQRTATKGRGSPSMQSTFLSPFLHSIPSGCCRAGHCLSDPSL